jgi:acetylglutamate kinase
VLAAIEKAEILVEAMQWIRRFRGKITVVKLGGSLMDSASALDGLLLDIVFMETVGMRPVVVHGGGAAISRAMAESGLQPRFIQGRRYTCERTLEVVEQVLTHEICADLVRRIAVHGGKARPLHPGTTPVLFGKRLFLEDSQGNPVDLGFVGTVTRVDEKTLLAVLDAGEIPVIPCLALGAAGEKLNVNADTAAMAVARALRAEKLVFLSDVNGVRRKKDDPYSLIPSLSVSEARELIRNGAIEGGMLPKIEACLETLAAGVGKIHIIDGRVPHSLLLEVYTDRGVGTEIVPDPSPQGAEAGQDGMPSPTWAHMAGK